MSCLSRTLNEIIEDTTDGAGVVQGILLLLTVVNAPVRDSNLELSASVFRGREIITGDQK